MGIKYNIAENNPMKFGFERQAAAGKYQLYRNENAFAVRIFSRQRDLQCPATSQ